MPLGRWWFKKRWGVRIFSLVYPPLVIYIDHLVIPWRHRPPPKWPRNALEAWKNLNISFKRVSRPLGRPLEYYCQRGLFEKLPFSLFLEWRHDFCEFSWFLQFYSRDAYLIHTRYDAPCASCLLPDLPPWHLPGIFLSKNNYRRSCQKKQL